jgi:hypothetical protein
MEPACGILQDNFFLSVCQDLMNAKHTVYY